MTIISTSSADIGGILLAGFVGLAAVCVIFLIIFQIQKNGDNSKPVFTKKAKILEKKLSQGNIEWYVVEMEDGERMQLRSFNAQKMIISAGDTGTISYRGKTIVSFERR